jgi:8-oxo-dGTP pyrophosphatase MutT (NUDIX family)
MKIDKNLSLNREGQYCIECLSETIERVFQSGLTYYHCHSCSKTLDRSLVIDNDIVWWVDKDNVYWHESVGVLVVVGDKLLTFLRKIYPFSYTIPAGHLDKNELPEIAACRELCEETNISISSLELMKKDFDIYGDSCRRGSDNHRWNLYRIKLTSFPNISLSDEASEVRWMTFSELRKEQQLTYPLKIFVETIGKNIFL